MKIKKLLCGVLSLLLCLAFVVACAPGEGGGGGIKVTYDYNYDGAPEPKVETIEESDVAPMPEDPVRDRYEFTGWYTDAACTTDFDFEEALYEDTTIYAGWELAGVLVTFNYNYEGAPAAEVKTVDVGGTVTQPTDPSREGSFLFTGWYTDEDCTKEFDFSTAISEDTTLYAGWEEVAGDVVTLTYMWNYEGAPDAGVANTARVQKGRKPTMYKAAREGFYFEGWYTDAACTQKFDFNKVVNEDQTLYAHWYKINKFEAEYTDFTGVTGSGYSGGGGGLDNVVRDTFNAGASNGFYVSNMYCYGSSLTFVINAEEAAENVVLALRLSAEYFDMTITDEMYTITVNDTKVEFDDISFVGVPSYTQGGKLAFRDYELNKGVTLKEGENIVKIEVTNNIRMQESGTLNATAPMVDCLYLYTDVALSWTEKTSNLDNK